MQSPVCLLKLFKKYRRKKWKIVCKHGQSTCRSQCYLEIYRMSLNTWYHFEKNMDFSEKHQLLSGNFHAIFDKIETDMFQIIRTWSWIKSI